VKINHQNGQTSRSVDRAPRALFDLATGKPQSAKDNRGGFDKRLANMCTA
jgi:hypothetical protein